MSQEMRPLCVHNSAAPGLLRVLLCYPNFRLPWSVSNATRCEIGYSYTFANKHTLRFNLRKPHLQGMRLRRKARQSWQHTSTARASRNRARALRRPLSGTGKQKRKKTFVSDSVAGACAVRSRTASRRERDTSCKAKSRTGRGEGSEKNNLIERKQKKKTDISPSISRAVLVC